MPTTTRTKRSEKRAQLIVWMTLGLLIVSLCISWGVFAMQVNKLEASTEGLNFMEYISSGAQRLVKLELAGTQSDEVIFYLDTTIEKLSPGGSNYYDYFPGDEDITQGILDATADWDVLKTALEEYRDTGDSDALLSASERHFYHTVSLTNDALDYIEALSAHILFVQGLIIAQIGLMVLLIGHQLYCVWIELVHNRALSEKLSLDTSTGLFNRSKCQEILKNDLSHARTKWPAIIVFDLNDLKKTNDKYGHRIGDELIANFAKIIKDATKIFNYDVFVGRYGGDEFIVYYNAINEYDVKLYLEEVAFLADYFNNHEERYQVSFAAGYAVRNSNDGVENVRQLFDLADAQMYINKTEMKRKRALEADDYHDDRL